MRVILVIAVVACGGYRSRPPTHVSRPGCTIDGTLVEIGADRMDTAPLVVAYVHHSFRASDVFAVWADGAVVTNVGRDLVQGRVSPADATRVAREVAAGLARAPDYAELSGPIDQPRVEFVARDGTHWRHALVWGARPTSYGDAPEGFQTAYRALQSLHPATTAPFQPDELAIAYEPVDLGVPPVAWPAEIPEPPVDRTTATLDPRYDAPLRALLEGAGRHPIAFANKTWRIEIRRKFRGELVIDNVRRCASRRA